MSSKQQRWKELHLDTCRSLHSITATPKQVLEYQAILEERPINAVMWKNQENAIQQVGLEILHPLPISSWSVMTTPLSWLYQRMMTPTEKPDEGEWQQEDDEFHTAQISSLAGWEDVVLNVPLAAELCQQIIQNSNTKKVPRVFSRDGTDLDTSFFSWCQHIATTDSVISKISTDQLSFLLQVLVHTNYATIQDHYIVLHDTQSSKSCIETAIVNFQLQQSIIAMETQISRWTINIQHLEQQIEIIMKGSNTTTTAKAKATLQIRRVLKQKKIIEQHVESARSTLLNLEQTRATFETTASQLEILDLLQRTNDAWKELTKGVSVEQVDQVVMDLQEEMQLGMDVNSAMEITTATTATTVTPTVDEDEEILKELERLTLSGDLTDHGYEKVASVLTTFTESTIPIPTLTIIKHPPPSKPSKSPSPIVSS
jgi:Snf7